MANCFGEVVDNYKLDGIRRYVGHKKTQQDRAREAMNLINEDGKDDKASTYVNQAKDWYGVGESTLCLVYNATGGTLTHVSDHDWWGFIGRTPYPTEIGNGQWAAFLHVHKSADPSGSEAAVVYRAKNLDGSEYDVLIGWSTPLNAFSKNKAYCEVGAVNSFQGRWDDIYDRLNGADYSWSSNSHGFHVQVDTATGNSPIFKAIIKVPYDP